jgi:hypothetical protein
MIVCRDAPPVLHRHADLGGKDDVLAPGAERFAEEFFGNANAAAIHIGGVEEGDAEIERFVHDRKRCRVIDAAAKVVAAQADDRYAQP